MLDKISQQTKNYYFEDAILIRMVEENLLDLFSQGLLNGTVHTCIGQELSALAFGKQIHQNDFVFSNHRCHGHYIGYGGPIDKLLAEDKAIKLSNLN